MSSLQSFFYASQFSIIGVTKTWLSDQIFNHEILPSGYVLYCHDRNSQRGGVLLAVDKSIPGLSFSTPPDFEVVTIFCFPRSALTVSVAYTPPNASENYLSSLCSYFSSLSPNSTPMLIMGDFNYPDIDWARLHGSPPFLNMFCDFLFDSNLRIHYYCKPRPLSCLFHTSYQTTLISFPPLLHTMSLTAQVLTSMVFLVSP